MFGYELEGFWPGWQPKAGAPSSEVSRLRNLRNFMNDKCGLVNPANPCRCAKKTRGFIQAGYVDPENLLFVHERIREVRDVAPKVYETIDTLDGKCAEIFRGHPFYEAPPDIGQMQRRLVESPDLKLTG